MTHARRLCPAELATDVFDRASTLNFTTIARVEGPLTQERLEGALRALEQRHPLLRARIERASELSFVPGEAAPIPLRVSDAEPAAWVGVAEGSLAHRAWPDAGPRAELTWLRHGEGRSTLLLCLHHLVSDGSSGILAMRDLLRLVAFPEAAPEVVPSPGQQAFYPPGHGGFGWKLRTAGLIARSLLATKPKRLRSSGADPDAPRSVNVRNIELDRDDADGLIRNGRADGATVHGVLCAAFARAAAACAEAGTIPERILHPVDLRRFARAHHPGLPTAGDAVGYYVSSVDTDHRVDPSRPLGELAREITLSVRSKKEAGVPLLTAPIAGAWVTGRAPLSGDLPELRHDFETKLFASTFALTNLGPLEKLGVTDQLGPLRVTDVFFVAAGSVFGSLGGAATTFAGKITLSVNWVSPLVSKELGERFAERAEAELVAYARRPAAPPS